MTGPRVVAPGAAAAPAADVTAADSGSERSWWETVLAEAGGPIPLPARRPGDTVVTRSVPGLVDVQTAPGGLGVLVAGLLTRYGSGGPVVVTVVDHVGPVPVVVDLEDFPTRDEAVHRWQAAVADAAGHRADAPDADPTGPVGQVVVAVGGTWRRTTVPELAVGPRDGRVEITGPSAVVEAVAGHLTSLAGHWSGPRTLDAVPMLPADERARLVAAGRGRSRVVPPVTVWDQILERARATPHDEAVVADDARIDYAELVSRVDRVADVLRSRGVGRGDLVGLCTDRTTGMVVGLLGILAAGAAYVPIDLGYPVDRVAMMIEDADIRVAVTERALVDRVPERVVATVVLEDLLGPGKPSPVPVPRPGPASDVGPDDVAYVIFTSGSTGRPKGVVISHGALTNFVHSIAEEPGVTDRDRLLAVTTLSFDIAALELLVPLVVGGCVVVAGRSVVVDPVALAAAMDRERVTVMQATPATWQMLVDAGWTGRAGLRVLCGGEALPAALAERLTVVCDVVWNLYGPTETTIWSLADRVVPGGAVTIGRPIANTEVAVVGRRLELLPDGIAGELLIGGAGVALGYLGRPDLTAERFPPVVAELGGARFYRTGDVVRRRPDGRLEFLGRTDTQVKVRGFRVELGDVEAALGTHPAVARAVVVVRPDERTGANRLLAYVVLRPGVDASPSDLRDHAARVLPAHMVPAIVTVLPEFPLTPNAKVDRRALPEPVVPGRVHVAPRDDLERRLVRIWEEVLDVGTVGVTDDVFDLGASSLTTARLFTEIGRRLSVALPVAAVFEAPTVEALARRLRGELADPGTATGGRALVPVRPGGERSPLFLVHGGAGTVLLFQPLARRLSADVPVLAFQAVGLYGDGPAQWSVRRMARTYVEEMRRAQPHGPYRIGGYCFGALVAFEMARNLASAGERTELLVSFNGPSPRHIARYHPEFDAQGSRTDEFGRPVRRVSAGGPAVAPRPGGRSRLQRWRRKLGLVRLVAARRPLPEPLREFGAFQQIAAFAQTVYRPRRRYRGDLLVVRSDGLYREDDLGWSRHVEGRVEVVSSGSEQITPRQAMTDRFVTPAAEAVRSRLDRLDRDRRR